MKKKLFLSLLFTVIIYTGKAQTDQLIDEAEMYIYDNNFGKGAEIYKKLLKDDTENPAYNFRYGYCLLNTRKGVYSSIQYLEKAASIYVATKQTEGVFLDSYYTLGKAYHENYMFEEAITVYTKLKTYSDNAFFNKTVEHEIYVSKNALELFFNPKELIVAKLGVINSPYSDHSPVISGDESVLVDGQEMFLYRSVSENDGNIYYSKLEGEEWTVPVKLSNNINSKSRETSATISADGSKLYFSSNRKGGIGGYDIYVSNKKSDGTWSKAKNVGKPINTEFDEDGPYIHLDGSTLYFSSMGHPGMGGYDVFFSKKDANGNWTTPENLGFPLNTVDNDVYYVPTADGNRGYYSSQKGGISDIYIAQLFNQDEKNLTMVSGFVEDRQRVCSDTFKISNCKISGDTITTPQKRILYSDKMYYKADSVLITSRVTTENEIIVIDSTYKIPENAIIYVINADTKILENTYSPNSLTGKYIFVLNKNRNYKIYYEANGYLFDTKDIVYKEPGKYKDIFYEAHVDSIIKGKVKKSNKFGFDTGLTTINNFTSLELEIIAIFLKKHEDLYINFTGYDYLFDKSNRNFFPLEYEYAIERKKKVIKYLENKGINSKRIYTDMFPANINGDSIQYTIFDENALKAAEILKTTRERIFVKAYEEANKTEEEIYAQYGFDTLNQEKIIIVKDMMFDINKSASSKYAENLDRLAKYLIDNPDVVIEIGGYTDEQGIKEYNMKLAKKRAEFIKNQLKLRGVSKKQMKTKTYGYKNPIAKNKTEDGEFLWDALPYNRRVEIKILKESDKSTLFVKKVNVPEQFKVEEKSNISSKTFAISLLISDEKKDVNDFLNIKDIHEKHYSDGTYMYFYGEFNNKDEVLNELLKVQEKFPNAFIFVKTF